MKNKEKSFNKRFDIKGVLKNFFSSSVEVLSQEDEISNDADLSSQDKKELIASLKNNENLAHKLFTESIKKSAEKNTKNDGKNNYSQRNNLKMYNIKQSERGERVD